MLVVANCTAVRATPPTCRASSGGPAPGAATARTPRRRSPAGRPERPGAPRCRRTELPTPIARPRPCSTASLRSAIITTALISRPSTKVSPSSGCRTVSAIAEPVISSPASSPAEPICAANSPMLAVSPSIRSTSSPAVRSPCQAASRVRMCSASRLRMPFETFHDSPIANRPVTRSRNGSTASSVIARSRPPSGHPAPRRPAPGRSGRDSTNGEVIGTAAVATIRTDRTQTARQVLRQLGRAAAARSATAAWYPEGARSHHPQSCRQARCGVRQPATHLTPLPRLCALRRPRLLSRHFPCPARPNFCAQSSLGRKGRAGTAPAGALRRRCQRASADGDRDLVQAGGAGGEDRGPPGLLGPAAGVGGAHSQPVLTAARRPGQRPLPPQHPGRPPVDSSRRLPRPVVDLHLDRADADGRCPGHPSDGRLARSPATRAGCRSGS